MLTAKQNMQETIRGGNPDRFVNQYEAVQLLFHPYIIHSNALLNRGDMNVVNAWGVTNSFPENTPGAFPVHTPDKIVVKDITRWREYVHAPSLKFPDEEWAMFKAQYDAVDGTQAYKATFIAPGLFEQTHHLCGINNALVYYMTNPQEMHDLIKYLTDWELELAEGICSNLKPDAIFHHDDWGSERSTFLSPDMFAEFFLEPYKQIYGYYHDHGVELVIHHSDSYAATLVPYMIEMGIDIWQGCMWSNNIPELIQKYGGKISFMGGIDNKDVDRDGWTREDCRRVV
ncbi:MAG: uroporphyrinogen decarboxylase family protein, partial [Oscillospiraceae bacterium]